MKKIYFLIMGAVAISAITGATLATAGRQTGAQNQQSIETNIPESTSTSQATAIASTVKTNNDAVEATTPQIKTQTDVAIQPKLDDFPHQRIVLVDEVNPESDFAQFRQQLREAVRSRDAEFLQSILPPNQIGIGHGISTLPDLKLENHNAPIWGWLEKALAAGCFQTTNQGQPDVDPQSPGWICNTVPRDFAQQYPAPNSADGVSYELSRVIVVGENVNVRSQPSVESPVVGLLSNEVVKVNRQIEEQRARERAQRGEDYSSINGWTAVILPNGKPGYISNRFAYSPLEYQAVFGTVKGQWRLLYMPGGE